MKKILIIPARKHAIEAYTEYLIRYLSDEFYFEMGYPPIPPYHNIAKRVWSGETSPLEKNPDEFDLIYPHFNTHTFIQPPEKYYHKMVYVYLEPQYPSKGMAAVAATSKPVEASFADQPFARLRFGVDTELFQPYQMVRKDDLFHIGFVGNIQTPRRYMKDLFIPLHNIPGAKLVIYPASWHKHTRRDEIQAMGSQVLIDSIVDGDKWWSGFPNCYNQMDVYIRCDINPGYQFTVLEAAACGIPVVTTDPGLGKELAEAGGAFYIPCQDGNWEEKVLKELAERIKEKVLELKNDPKKRLEMGGAGRAFIVNHYQWKHHIAGWRNFFREGMEHAQKNMSNL